MAGGRREQDPRDVEGVQDLLRLVPEARRLEELDVESSAVSDRLPAA